MRKFNISVNGKSYSVEVEEIGGATVSAPIATAPTAPSSPVIAAPSAPVVEAKPVPKPMAAGNGISVKAPLPGSIVNVKVSNGQQVKKGDVILVLEAMKMENDVTAPSDGVITITVAKGAQVNTGDVIATIA